MDEFEIIRKHFKPLGEPAADVIIGVGDDGAVLAPTPGEQIVVTTDTLVSGRHFHSAVDPEDLGWKALAVNLSDLAAMGARPRWFQLALTLEQPGEDWLRSFARGLTAMAGQAGARLVGGDVTQGPLSITITAIGTVQAGTAIRRSCAKPGDLVCVTGTLGDAALALHLGLTVRPAGFRVDEEFLLSRLNRPTPRLSGRCLRGVARAAIDLSDGLAGDLRHVLEASWVGAEISAGRLPQSAAFARLAPPELRLRLQAAGGDDYELCLCIPPERLTEARRRLDLVPLTEIGQITSEAGLRWLDAQGHPMAVDLHGYSHFSNAA